MTFQPLYMVESFLQVCESAGERVRMSQEGHTTPFVTQEDKLAQLECYHAREGASFGQHCWGCMNDKLWPVSHPRGDRGVRWWCEGCTAFVGPTQREPVMHEGFKRLLQGRQYDGQPGLGHAMTPEDFDFFLRRLPRRKAAGADEIYYEMLAEEPDNHRAILLEGLNQLLAGRQVPDDWKGGTIRLLSKREPAHMLENMRPVTLLQTTYKLL